jgi:hypothetical protein
MGKPFRLLLMCQPATVRNCLRNCKRRSWGMCRQDFGA